MAAPTAACRAAYSWAPQDGAQRGQKVFMQVCAGCHVMLPYAGLRAAQGEVGAQTAEIVVAEVARPAVAARSTCGGAYQAELPALATKIHEVAALYTTGGTIVATMPRMLAGGVAVYEELTKKMAPPSFMWLQFVLN